MITQRILSEEVELMLQELKKNNAIYEFSEIVTLEELTEYIVFDVFYKKYNSLDHKTMSIYEIAKKISEEQNIDFENVKKQLLRDIEKFGERKNWEYSLIGEVPIGAFKYNQLKNNDRRSGHQLTPSQVFQLIRLYENRNIKDLFEKDWNNNNSVTGKHIKSFIESLKNIYERIEKSKDLTKFEKTFQYYQIEQSEYLNLHMHLLKDINDLKLTSSEKKEIISRSKIMLKTPYWKDTIAQNRLINSNLKITTYLKKHYYSEESFQYIMKVIVNTSSLKVYLAEYFFDNYEVEEFAFESYEWRLSGSSYLYIYPDWEKSSNIKLLRQFYAN